MNKNQWFGLFIIFVMVGSIVGFSTYFTGNPDNSDAVPDDSSLPDSTTLAMVAENVPAKVVEVLPSILFSAFTDQADITIIDKKIAEVKGIYRINSKYRQYSNPSFGTSLVYTAEISFENQKTAEEITPEITTATQGILFDSFAFSNVLVSVPKNVSFSNEQGFDLNYEFSDPLVLAAAMPGTIKGDELLVRIDAYFTGKTMVNSIASEATNLSSEPKFLSFDLNKTVEEMLPRIIFGSTVTYSDYVEGSSLKEKIIWLEGVVDVNISSLKSENYFVAYFDANTSLQQDFNEFFFENPSVFNSVNVSSVGNGFSAQVYFNEDINSGNPLNAEEKVKSFLEDKNASNISVVESSSQVFGSIELISADSSKTVSALNELLAGLNFSGTEVQQQAVVLFDSFFNEEGKTFVPDEKTETQVFVSPSRTVGEEVLLSVQVQTSRDRILSITAAEE